MAMFVSFGRRVKIPLQQDLQSGPKRMQCFCTRCISQSYYDVLKVPQTCSSKDVREAFINLSKKNHPDKHPNDPSMHERFIQINEAYTVLINPSSRRAYDMTLSHKKKLEASYTRPNYQYYQYNGSNYHQYHPNQQNKRYQSYTYNSSQKANSSNASDDTSSYYSYQWESDVRTNTGRKHVHNDTKGVKRISNAMLVSIFLFISFFSFGIQMIALRSHAMKTRDQMLEKSRKYNMMRAMTKEKIRLYGSKHQIEVLKRSLLSTFDVSESDEDLMLSNEATQEERTCSENTVDKQQVSAVFNVVDADGDSHLPPPETVPQTKPCPENTCKKCKKAKVKVECQPQSMS